MSDGASITFAAISALFAFWAVTWAITERRRLNAIRARRRYRLVTEQNGTEYVSDTAYRPDEIEEMLELEAWMHEGTGWQVQRHAGGMIRAEKGATVRWIWVRA